MPLQTKERGLRVIRVLRVLRVLRVTFIKNGYQFSGDSKSLLRYGVAFLRVVDGSSSAGPRRPACVPDEFVNHNHAVRNKRLVQVAPLQILEYSHVWLA